MTKLTLSYLLVLVVGNSISYSHNHEHDDNDHVHNHDHNNYDEVRTPEMKLFILKNRLQMMSCLG